MTPAPHHRVLIAGPSGAGKTFLARYLRKHGLPAFDADDVPGLSRYADLEGTPRKVTVEEWRKWEGITWIWDPRCLRAFLQPAQEVFLFGSADNMYELLGLFDQRFYLDAPRDVIAHRLRARRNNNFGRHEPQRGLVLGSLQKEKAKARKAGFVVLDASLPPAELMASIVGTPPGRSGSASGRAPDREGARKRPRGPTAPARRGRARRR